MCDYPGLDPAGSCSAKKIERDDDSKKSPTLEWAAPTAGAALISM
jgi:hypothetical protein